MKYDLQDNEMYFQLVLGPFGKMEAQRERKTWMYKWKLESKPLKLTGEEKAGKVHKKREK